jgi:hypothetical protein
VFSLPFFVVWSFVNSFAWYHGSTQALPATTIVLLILIWLCIGFPLTVLGGIVGKNNAGKTLASLLLCFTGFVKKYCSQHLIYFCYYFHNQ